MTNTANIAPQCLLYEHDEGRYAIAASADLADFAIGNPAWHRVGPIEIVRLPVVSTPAQPASPKVTDLREMLRSLQACELTVSRASELIMLWLAWKYSDDMLPPVTPEAVPAQPVAAVRDAALEEAARVIEAHSEKSWPGTEFYSAAAQECAELVRALKGTPAAAQIILSNRCTPNCGPLPKGDGTVCADCITPAAAEPPEPKIDMAPMYKALMESRIALLAVNSGASMRAIRLIDDALNASPPAAAEAQAIPLSMIRDWAERRIRACGPAGVTDQVAMQEEAVRWAESQIKEDRAAIRKVHVEKKPCDAGEICLHCQPRNADGSCPDAPRAQLSGISGDVEFWPCDAKMSRKQLVERIGQMNFRLTAYRQENAGLIKRNAGQSAELKRQNSGNSGEVDAATWGVIEKSFWKAFEFGKKDYRGCARDVLADLRAAIAAMGKGDAS